MEVSTVETVEVYEAVRVVDMLEVYGEVKRFVVFKCVSLTQVHHMELFAGMLPRRPG